MEAAMMVSTLYGYATLWPSAGVTLEQRNAHEHQLMLLRLQDKDGRMNRRLSRQRVAVWKRRWWKGAAVMLALVAIPGAIVIVTKAWGWAVQAVLG